jgi:hypothetical protein
MDFYRNADKFYDYLDPVSYNQITDVTLDDVVTEPVTLNELKLFAKIEYSTDDSILTGLITAARQMCEKYSNISFVKREVTAYFTNYNGGTYLPYGPVDAITGVYTAQGDPIEYIVQGTSWKQIISPQMPLKAIYEGGYDMLPENLKTAVMAQALFLYENRGDSIEAFSPIALMLLNPVKRL